MPTAAEVKKTVADWTKWAVMLSWAVVAAVIGHSNNLENRLTKLESWKESHSAGALKTEAELRGQLQQQKNDGEKILTAITAVQVEVAKINGYLESRKASNQQ